ncbi:MAG: TIGR01777 family oxidoreductase [Gemmatimonadaceae bacterium]
MNTVAITGASGFLGSALAAALRAEGFTVLSIGRGERADIRWSPRDGRLDGSRLEGAQAVVNLAGENLAQRWTETRKREIRASRVDGTALLARTLMALGNKPAVLVSGSAIGYYGARRLKETLSEQSAPGSDYLAAVARDWEQAADPARQAGIRVAYVRSGIVLNPKGGVLQRLLPIFSLGAGGRLGDGNQWMSWIALSDWVRAVRFLLGADLSGPVNLVAPNPVRNRTFTEALGRSLGRPTAIPVPEFAVRLAFGEMGEATVLADQCVHPDRLLEAGFEFRFPKLMDALSHELKQR